MQIMLFLCVITEMFVNIQDKKNWYDDGWYLFYSKGFFQNI